MKINHYPIHVFGRRFLLTLLAIIPWHSKAQPEQPAVLAPMETSSGMVFRCYAPDARKVYLAADFNHWADNIHGVIRDDRFAMHGPDEQGVFSATVPLSPGVYRYKYSILGGSYNGWFIPQYSTLRDDDGNALVIVDGIPDGDNRVRVARAPHPGDGGIVFEFHAPDAHIVHLAGTFNQWAENRNGRVHQLRFAMKGPDSFGLWRTMLPLRPGRYEYKYVINGREWVKDPLVEQTGSDNRSVLEVR